MAANSTVDRRTQLAAASATMVARFPGKSARQRGEEKQRQALDWVYRWGWSSPGTIERVGGAARSGLAARLVRRGLLEETRTDSGGAHRGVPVKVLTLTLDGLQEVERTRQVLLPYELGGARVRQDGLRKFQLAQAATIQALNEQTVAGFLVDKEMGPIPGEGVKHPDIVWTLPNGDRLGVEVELASKWGRDLDVFVHGCVSALSSVNGQKSRYDRIALVSDSMAILRRYSLEFERGKRYQVWGKDARGHWQVVETRTIPEGIKEKMLWHKAQG